MYRVVLVEDEELLRQGLMLTTPWAEHGYQVAGSAADATEGERVILETRPDLVITDIRLPRVLGLDMIESLNAKIACDYIIISGYDDFDYAQRAIGLGVRAYLVKPIGDDELAAALDRAAGFIARRRQIEEMLRAGRAGEREAAPVLGRNEKSLGDRYMEAAVAHIRANFMNGITVKSVADALGISESYLTKLFKRKAGASFLSMLTKLRMEEAVRLLEESDLKIFEIADRLGYQDAQYFSSIFRRATGVNPSEYKRRV